MSEDIYGHEPFGEEFWKLVERVEAEKNPEITDEAIRRVPFTRFPEFSEEESTIIRKLEMLVLKSSKEYNEHKEVAIIYNHKAKKDGLDFEKYNKKCMAYALINGSNNSVNIDGDAKERKMFLSTKEIVLVAMHNHPYGTSFSIDDCFFFANHKNIKLFIDVHQDGCVEYISRTRDFDEYTTDKQLLEIIRDKINNFIKTNKGQITKLYGEKFFNTSPFQLLKEKEFKDIIPRKTLRSIVDEWISKAEIHGLVEGFSDKLLKENNEDAKYIKKWI